MTRSHAGGWLRGSTALCALLLALAEPASAQQTTDQTTDQTADQTAAETASAKPVDLAPITVKQAKGASGAPLRAPKVLTKTVDRQQLDRQQVQNFTELGQQVDAGISYDASTKSVGMRGLSANRVLTTLDGIPLPWLEDGARGVQGGSTSFDFDMLSSLSVIPGGDSSLYGSDALAGVVAARTLDPEDILKDGRSFGGLTRMGFDSGDNQWKIRQALAGHVGRTWYLLEGTYGQGHETKNKGTIGGEGTSRTKSNPADTRESDFLFKVHHYLDGGQRLGFSAENYDSRNDIDLKTSEGTTYAPGYSELDRVHRQRISASYDLNGVPGAFWFDQAHVTLYWQRLALGTKTQAWRLTAPVGQYDRDSTLEERSLGLTGTLEKTLQTGALTHDVLLAFDGSVRRTSQYAAGADNCTSAIYACSFLHINQSDMPTSHGATLGLSAQDTIHLPGGKLRVIPGLRYDYYSENPQDTASYEANPTYTGLPASSSGGYFSPKLRVEWDALPQTTFYAQWSEGFRAPSATELYLSYGGPGSYISAGNPDLKPETVRGWEVGANLGDQALGGKISLYDNRYHNFIDSESVDPSAIGLSSADYPYGAFEYVNRAHVRIYGVDLSGHWQFRPDWRLWTSISYAHGRDTDEDEALNSVPPLKGIFGIGYANQVWGSDLSLVLAAARNDVEDPSSDLNKLPGYGVVNLTAWWKPSRIEGLTIQAGLFNLFNKTYWDTLEVPTTGSLSKDYYTAAGRSVKLAATYRF